MDGAAKRSLKRVTLAGLLFISAGAAQAQEAAGPEEKPAVTDGGRFRSGINATLGLESVSAGGASISGLMYGLDFRLGWQVNDLLGIYVEPHLSFGSLGNGGTLSGFTGTFAATVLGEYTHMDRFYVAGGGGYGILNNPSGPALELKAGFYPVVSRSDREPRRRGLQVGATFRSIFADGGTGILVMGTVGYEKF